MTNPWFGKPKDLTFGKKYHAKSKVFRSSDVAGFSEESAASWRLIWMNRD